MRRSSAVVVSSGNGAIVVAVMGSIWILTALRDHLSLLALVFLAPLTLTIWGIQTIRTGKRLRQNEEPPTEIELATERALSRRFMWIFAGEGVAIFIAVNVLANMGRSAFLAPTIGVIVGLHFLPLAALYRLPLYYWSGAIQILACFIAGFALRSNLPALNTATGVSMALILWATMFVMLFRSRDVFYGADSARSLA